VSSVHPFDAQNTTETKAKQLLLQWCQQQIQGYPSVRVDNLDLRFVSHARAYTVYKVSAHAHSLLTHAGNSWQDGLGFCALLHKYRPDMIDYNTALVRSPPCAVRCVGQPF
jgi:hypothetical protein